MRELCNLAYASLAEGRDQEGVTELDVLLEQGDDAVKAYRQRNALKQLAGFASMPTRRS